MVGNPFSRRRRREGWDDESNQPQISEHRDTDENYYWINAEGHAIMDINDIAINSSVSSTEVTTDLKCIRCNGHATYIYNGNSLCQECINSYRGEYDE